MLLTLPFVLLAGLVALVVVLVLRASDQSARDDARQAALLTARQEAVNLTTLSYTTANRDLDRILGLATGGLRQGFASKRAQLPSVLARDKSQSRGTVLSAALVRLSPGLDAAQAVVATDATVSTGTQGNNAGSVLKHYRMVMQLQLVGGRWLVSDVAFAGVPQ